MLMGSRAHLHERSFTLVTILAGIFAAGGRTRPPLVSFHIIGGRAIRSELRGSRLSGFAELHSFTSLDFLIALVAALSVDGL